MWRRSVSKVPHKTRGDSDMRLLIMVLALGFAGFIMCQPFYWYFISDGFRDEVASCPSCECGCSKLEESANMALAKLPKAMSPGCDQDIIHQGMQDEVNLRKYQLLREELELQERKANTAEEESQRALLDVQSRAAQYRKERGKCVEGMMTTEYAREKVEAALKLEKESSTLWETRAIALGWKHDEERTKII